MTEKHRKEKHQNEPDQPVDFGIRDLPTVGLWSRSFALRAVVWIGLILIVIVLALFATAYLSGFASLPEMFTWFKESFFS